MTFKQAINLFPLFKNIYEQLVIKTSMGRDWLFGLEFSQDKEYLQRQYALTQDCQNFIANLSQNDKMLLECVLYDIHNISGSLRLIQQKEVLDDVGLFEVKAFCLACKRLKAMIKPLKSKEFVFNDLQDVITLLDPEGLEVNQFYIYPAYDERLSGERKLFEKYKKEENPLANEVYEKICAIENEVRERLCTELLPKCKRIQEDIFRLALLDISIAKAELNIELNLVVPSLSDETLLSYKGIFNPVIKQALLKRGKDFQAIDIEVKSAPVLITGANMAGKTVVLKTLALAQLLAQFGFFVPCESCIICLVENVLTSIGDNQNEAEGLSSFASEILCLNSIIKNIKTGKRYLVLVDELARTTNPVEGVKLLNGFISTLHLGNSLSVTTTHYSDIAAPCERLRVRGFIRKNLASPVSIENLADNIDYSLIADNSNEAPTEAVNLCELLGIDKDWIENTKKSN
ncbi:MAG: hypothetical protein IJ748_05475 [Bacteroidales bacterium]|nr:hypothetical protein [Bacteroidales bacterium]